MRLFGLDVKRAPGNRIEVIRLKGESARPLCLKTRIVVLCFALLLSTTAAGTLSFLQHVTNQEPNRVTVGQVGIAVLEQGSVVGGSTAEATIGGTIGVQVRVPSGPGAVPAVVRVSFVPEATSASASSGDLAFAAQDWSAPAGDDLLLGCVSLHLASGWEGSWQYRDGSFYCRMVLEPGQTTPVLLETVNMAAGYAQADYDVKVHVLAEAIQASPADAPAAWGCTVDGAGNVTVSP